MKKNIFLLIPVLLFLLAFAFSSEWLIYDDAVTVSNDSLESEWTKLYGANVELYLVTSDTMRINYYIDYRMSTEPAWFTLSVDSLVTKGTALEWKAKTIVLRGQSDSSIVNKIPGADFMRLRAYRDTSSETSGSFHGGLNQY